MNYLGSLLEMSEDEDMFQVANNALQMAQQMADPYAINEEGVIRLAESIMGSMMQAMHDRSLMTCTQNLAAAINDLSDSIRLGIGKNEVEVEEEKSE